MLKFIELPSRYTPLGKFKQCPNCKNMIPKICLCLLCNWKGCVKCEKNIEGLSNHANTQHGKIGLFLDLSKTYLIYAYDDYMSQLDPLYKDELSNIFKISDDWDKFELDEVLLQRMY